MSQCVSEISLKMLSRLSWNLLSEEILAHGKNKLLKIPILKRERFINICQEKSGGLSSSVSTNAAFTSFFL